eukprot:3057519-Amphidinium_carterae.1
MTNIHLTTSNILVSIHEADSNVHDAAFALVRVFVHDMFGANMLVLHVMSLARVFTGVIYVWPLQTELSAAMVKAAGRRKRRSSGTLAMSLQHVNLVALLKVLLYFQAVVSTIM